MEQRIDAIQQEEDALEESVGKVGGLYKERRQPQQGLPADYRDATPRDVAEALLKYRPKSQEADSGE